MKKKQTEAVSGVLLFAKQSGITSFSSLWSIKHALGTDKVGHTGTLDSFADGLLVVLSGSLTHLVPHITGFKKTYRAVVCFGSETDTLDPCGKIINRKDAPSREQVQEACRRFMGALLQVPPAYSAVHVGGKRASDMARGGNDVALEPRQIFIYRNELLDFRPATGDDSCAYALLEITCSKGTYIRSLARDMAASVGSCAHLSALRRMSVGPFNLEDAACISRLPEFTIEAGIAQEKHFESRREKDDEATLNDIRSHFMLFTPSLACKCGFRSDQLKSEYERPYLNGRPLSGRMFTRLTPEDAVCDAEYTVSGQIAVFYPDSQFAGMIRLQDGRLSYGFVVPHKTHGGKNFRTFTWEQILGGAFPLEWKKQGSALTVGSFDGMHAGHASLIDSVVTQKNLVGGIVMFRESFRAGEADFAGDVATLRQRLAFCADRGLAFAIVIDFSDDFSKIEGNAFVRTLTDLCGMRFMAEGLDFRCGFKGATAMRELAGYADTLGFALLPVEDVLLDDIRISSSRIRRAVQEADFIAAQKMLQRPFAYDCTGLSWKKSADGDGQMSWFSAACVSRQVTPPDGTYTCVACYGEETLHTMCALDKEHIRLLLPTEHIAGLVESVTFYTGV